MDLIKNLRAIARHECENYGTTPEDATEWKAADEIETLRARIAELEQLSERLKQEAQIHAMEARTANATIAEIYQLCSGSTGEAGNWNGAEPVRLRLAEIEKQRDGLAKDAERYLKAITAYADGVKLEQSRIDDPSFDWKNLEAVDYIDHEEIMAGLELEKIAALASVQEGGAK